MAAHVEAVVLEPVTVDVIREHGAKLLQEHWEEIGKTAPVREPPPDPAWHTYYLLEEKGALVVYAARRVDAGWESVCGYGVMVVARHPHFDQKVAKVDLLFVPPKARRYTQGLGRRLMSAMEAAAREAGAELLCVPAKPGTPLDALLPECGFRTQEMIYAKELSYGS